MFLKIYKHSFLAPLKTLVPLFIANFALAILGGISVRIANTIEDNVSLATFFGTIAGLSSVGLTGLAFGEFVLVISAFKKAVATDEAYLTYTLPATAGQQLGARTLSIATWYVIISVVSIIATVTYSAFSGEPSFIVDVSPSIELNPEATWIIIEVVIMAIVMVASILLHVIFGVLLSQKLSTKTKTKSANAMTVIIGFAEGFVLLIVFITLVVGLLATENSAVLNASPHVIIWTITVTFGMLGGLCYYLSYKMMSRWLNLA
ncbi:MAG: hypothetical protein IJW64_01715 [Clostridia bacterium]|nr:hypothetical protein [Clostridia bacterium]